MLILGLVSLGTSDVYDWPDDAGETCEIIENPREPSLESEKPELDSKYLETHAPVVSIRLVEEDCGADLVSFSLSGRPESQEVSVVSRSAKGAIHRFSIHRSSMPDLDAHLRHFEKVRIRVILDEEFYMPTSFLSLWVTGRIDRKFVEFKAPPQMSNSYSYTGDGVSADQELLAWTRELVRIVKKHSPLHGEGPCP